jgi:hypothetical protein
MESFVILRDSNKLCLERGEHVAGVGVDEKMILKRI